MNVKEVTCILCPLGCAMGIRVEADRVLGVKGNKCKEGIKHAHQEVFSPGRILTTTVRTGNPESPLIPARSDKPIPKEKLEKSIQIIAEHVASGPIQIGEVIVSNILDTGVNIIASRSMGGEFG